ncbi:hypothetical protein HID58_024120 [Brassica napus]|uniref:Uncharacterized protein n=1 Tax=Brassica napus TaxID=3708 RepID=A0ABQ8D410_BRANA|nr:hypothetical protein HID58_024120 [Brassica napus]
MRASLTMLCPPELRGAGRSRRTLNLVEDLVDDGAWRRIDVSSNSTLPPCVVARWVEERCDEQSRTFSPLAAEVYSKEHQRPQASSSGAPLRDHSVVNNCNIWESLGVMKPCIYGLMFRPLVKSSETSTPVRRRSPSNKHLVCCGS